MPLEAQIDSEKFEALDEGLRDNYVKHGDGYRLAALEGWESQDDIAGLKSALQKERENSRKASSELSALREKVDSIDLDEYNTLKEQQAKAEEQKLEEKGQFEALKTQMQEGHAKELQKLSEREQGLISTIEKITIDNAALAALSELKGNTELLLPHVKNRTKLVEENGEFAARVTDAAGNLRVKTDGEYMTVKDLVSEMRGQDTFAAAFEADVPSGGGTPPGGKGSNESGSGGGTPPGDLKRSTMTPREKVAYIREHGEEGLLKLPA